MGVQAQLVCPLHDLLALLGTDVVGNLHGILLIVHEQHLQVSWASHDKLVEAILQAEPGLLVRSVANLGAQSGALESPTHAAIDASGLAPSRVHALEAVCLEARELLRALLHNLPLVRWCRHGCLSGVQSEGTLLVASVAT